MVLGDFDRSICIISEVVVEDVEAALQNHVIDPIGLVAERNVEVTRHERSIFVGVESVSVIRAELESTADLVAHGLHGLCDVDLVLRDKDL